MSEVQTVRGFINQRLSAAAEEIFELFERTIAEYEEKLCRSKEENERQKKLLEAVCNPQLRLRRADVQQLVVSKEPPPEQQKGGQGLEQEDSELPHIKEEQEELWSSQEGEQLHEPEEETPQSSQLHQKHNEENRDSVEEPGPVNDSDPETEDNSGDTAEPETEVINAHQQTEEAHLGLNPSKKAGISKKGRRVRLFPCYLCGKQFSKNFKLKIHMRIHSGEKPFSCSVCGRGFALKGSVKSHMTCHTGEKPYSCPLCDKRFAHRTTLKRHVRIHTGEKPFTCSSCNKRFNRHDQLKSHKCRGEMSQFNKRKRRSYKRQTYQMETGADGEDCGGPGPDMDLDPETRHDSGDTAEPDTEIINALQRKLEAHLGLDPSKILQKRRVRLHECLQCGKSFTENSNLRTHMRIHSGEKPFVCSFCGKGFAQKRGMQNHVKSHTGEKTHS